MGLILDLAATLAFIIGAASLTLTLLWMAAYFGLVIKDRINMLRGKPWQD